MASPGLKWGIIQHFYGLVLKSYFMLIVETKPWVRGRVVPAAFLLLNRSGVYLSRFTLHLLLCSWVTLCVCRREEIRRKEECIVWRHHFSLCLSRDIDLVTWYAFNYGGHVIRIQLWRNCVFNRSFHQKTTTIYYSTPIFNWQEEIQKLVCCREELDDKWSQKSASFCQCRSCDFTDLYTTTGKQNPKCDWFTWQEVMSFTGTSSVQTTGGDP